MSIFPVELAKITTPETLDSSGPHQPDKGLEEPLSDITIASIIDSTTPHTDNHGPENTIDGDNFSYWNPHGAEEFFITFELSERYTVLGVNLLNHGDYYHDVTKFKLEASNNLDSWYFGGSVDDVEAGTHEWQSFDGFTASGKYLRITFTETYAGFQPWLSELSFSGNTAPPLVDVVILEAVDSSGPHGYGGGPEKTIDGNEESHWNPDIPDGYNYNNWYIEFLLSERYTVFGINLMNYGDGIHDVTKFKLESSDNQITWHMVGSVGDVLAATRKWQSFGGFIGAGKYLKITITETASDVAGSDLSIATGTSASPSSMKQADAQ
ncbi:unnamed protein product [Meganyctiphanes norvegica]|uniref:F5/8 type C domain-containing protein n=1 Tax=Meganyctiphanes norvegica TaxID=48144 RepID=A0AAV2RR23_MEGNR